VTGAPGVGQPASESTTVTRGYVAGSTATDFGEAQDVHNPVRAGLSVIIDDSHPAVSNQLSDRAHDSFAPSPELLEEL